MEQQPVIILAIESSCDDTSAAVLKDGVCLSNVTANQKVHEEFGGVVPELASRAHQANIVPTVDLALKKAGIAKEELTAIGYTQGPGLLGSLLVGSSFAKSLAMSLNIPLIDVNHMQGHVLAHFIQEKDTELNAPSFPFLCLTVSGGHTQIVVVKDYFDMEVIGETKDDAAGEAFDKIAKIMSLPYPGGPLIDKYAQNGNPKAFEFAISKLPGLNFSFSGLKTSVLYFLQKKVAENPNFIQENIHDICASVQYTIVETLMRKIKKACKETGIKTIAIAGGVSANSGLRNALLTLNKSPHYQIFIPPFEYTTDNAAMIGIVAHLKYLNGDFGDISDTPKAKLHL